MSICKYCKFYVNLSIYRKGSFCHNLGDTSTNRPLPYSFRLLIISAILKYVNSLSKIYIAVKMLFPYVNELI